MEFDELSRSVIGCATRQSSAWLADQFQRHKTAKRHQTFRSVILRALRVLRGFKIKRKRIVKES
jgi:uncharacterized membrane protein YsdA (DUF1294 family)